jgi:hypothetical protein
MGDLVGNQTLAHIVLVWKAEMLFGVTEHNMAVSNQPTWSTPMLSAKWNATTFRPATTFSQAGMNRRSMPCSCCCDSIPITFPNWSTRDGSSRHWFPWGA